MAGYWKLKKRKEMKDYTKIEAAGVPFFFKQGSQNNWPDYKNLESFPAELQVREFPTFFEK